MARTRNRDNNSATPPPPPKTPVFRHSPVPPHPKTAHQIPPLSRCDLLFSHSPTTKAEALNRCWRTLLDDEATEGVLAKAIVLHDAEDVVHRHELAVFDLLIERFEMVQLPVLPLAHHGSRLVAGHYQDEFAESHAKQLVVREAIGAGVPAAGTGCALSRTMLGAVADANGGAPFDDRCLTEDYEIGLRLADFGGRAAFVRIPAIPGGAPVAVRAHFPDTFAAAVRQKARWIDGIALAGWDRLGWRGGSAEIWMRLRDRRAPVAALVLTAAYVGMFTATAALALRLALGLPAVEAWRFDWLGAVLAFLLVWRAAVRVLFVARAYGWREGLWSLPRLVVANIILIASARRALGRYLSAQPRGWDKTDHIFPTVLPAE